MNGIAVAYFFAGLFLANSVPHLVQGICGNRFPSPFASPPGVGESSPLVNVLWGSSNLVIGYYLLHGVGDFQGGLSADVAAAGLGALVVAIGLAIHFGRVRAASKIG